MKQAVLDEMKTRWMVLVLTPALGISALAGEADTRFHVTLERVRSGGFPRYTDDLLLRDVIPQTGRRFTEYSGDLSGRYIEAVAIAAREGALPGAALDALLSKVIANQKSEGYFGRSFGFARPQRNDMSLLWGNGRLLIGLMEAYRYQARPEVLASAKRLGDFFVSIAPVLRSEEVRQAFASGQFASGYICWTQVIEGMVALFKATGEARYLDVARGMAQRLEMRPGEHSHGFLTTLRGVLALYEATGERRYLDLAEGFAQKIIDGNFIGITGAVPEAWNPKYTRDEGCSDADWVRFNLTLWRLTGKAQYVERAETAVFNGLAFNQFSTGDFGDRILGPTGSPLGRGTARAWWCCTLHGLRCLEDVRAGGAFRFHQGTLEFGLPVDGKYFDGTIEVKSESNLERDGSVTLTLARVTGLNDLEIRTPAWSDRVEVQVNGMAWTAQSKLKRAWKNGDRVRIRYHLQTRLVKQDGTKRIAIFHGPWLLGVDEESSPSYFNEPMEANRVILPRDLRFTAERSSGGRFEIPVARFRLTYRPGGYPMVTEDAILRPIAEQTGFAAAQWEYRFEPAEPEEKK